MAGTMRERSPGVWELRVFVGRDPVTKRPKQKSRTVRGGKRAAEKALAGLVTDAAAGKFKGTDAKVSDLLTRYFAHLERRGLSPKTLHNYRRYADNILLPAFGSVAVRKLTAYDLDQLYAKLTDDGKAPGTVRLAHAVLSGALGQAVKWGWVTINVAKMASPPAVRPAKVVAPTAAEVRALVEAAEAANPDLAAMILLAALTGARRGELCALRWTDVDLDAGTVRIARSILDLPGRVEEKATKTHAERTLTLGDAGVALLALHRHAVDDRARIGETEVPADAFVFSERLDAATPIRPDTLTRFFTARRDALGYRHIHLHSLRHWAATEMARQGDVSVRTLAGRLGHADASVTLRVYSAFFPGSDSTAADHLGRALKP